MVVRRENKGFSVSKVSIHEFKDIIKNRCWFEEIALRESIKNANDNYDEEILLAVHRLSKADTNDISSYEKLRRDFHTSILSACNSNLLLLHCQQLYEQTLRYQYLSLNIGDVVDIEDYKNILDAILSRNEEKALNILLSTYKELNKKLILEFNVN